MSKESVVNEIHKTARVNFQRRRVIMKDIDDLWQADLVDMQAHSKDNSGNKYILVVIDCFSKYAWSYPLQQKNKAHVTQGFRTILDKGRCPKNLQTDLGKEFYNDNFKTIMIKNNINHYSTYSTKKASIVERFIRTLKNMLYKQFSLKGNYKWNNGLLDAVMTKYNNSRHRAIAMKPIEVNHKNKHIILQRYNNLEKALSLTCKSRSIKNNDFVRISKYKGTFEKGYTPNWSTEIFKIIKVQSTNPVTYLLEDSKHHPILGAFYAEELLTTKHPDVYLVEKVLKRKGSKVFVKWLGFPDSENSWIEKSNAL